MADDLLDRLRAEREQARSLVAAASTTDELRGVERSLLGKVSLVAATKEGIKELDAGDRPLVGKALQAFRDEVAGLLEAREAELVAAETAERGEVTAVDVTLPGRTHPRGHLHLVTQVWRELEDVFAGMGYRVAEGPEVETDWHNFTALNMPETHPARSMFDTLYVRLGQPGEVLLRTHTSPVQVRVMESQPPPIYVVVPGRVYRRDTLDATHSPMFHQIEGLAVDHGLTFGDLAGTIEAFTEAYFGPGYHARLRPFYFPFTEPSAEFEITCIFCEGSGCPTCSQTGWIELGGCGMVHPNVLRNCRIDPEEYTGFAFGFGLDRMAMIRYGVEHIKTLFENDVRFLAQF